MNEIFGLFSITFVLNYIERNYRKNLPGCNKYSPVEEKDQNERDEECGAGCKYLI